MRMISVHHLLIRFFVLYFQTDAEPSQIIVFFKNVAYMTDLLRGCAFFDIDCDFVCVFNVFHNDDINIHHAQLIFNTHNPIFLNSNLLRRDEIKFVERDDDSHCSTLYALSDFGTSGAKGVRMHEDYMKNYFISQYGAIKDIDFTPIFEEIMVTESEA